MPLSTRARVVLWIVHGAAFSVLAVTCLQYLNRPMRWDEVELAWQAREGVRVNGAPMIKLEQSLREMPAAEARFGAFYGLWHPPLYVYLLALATLAGPGDAWLRAVGVVCLGLSFGIIWRMSRDALGADAPRLVVALPISFAVFSPIVTQGSLYVDIDNTILATLMLLFLWQFTQPGDRLTPRRLAWLVALLTLMLCAKLTTLPMVWLACVVYAAAGDRPRRDLLAVTIVGAGAVAVFGVMYAAYCAAFRLPLGYMFDLGFGGRFDLFGSLKTVAQVIRSARWNLAWMSPVLAVLLAGVAVERVAAYVRTRRVTPPDAWLILSLGMYVAYVLLGAMMGKYAMPAALMGAAAVGLRAGRGWADWRLPGWPVIGGWLIVLAAAVVMLPVPIQRTAASTPPGRIAGDPRLWAVAAIVAAVVWIARVWVRSAPGSWHGDRSSLAGLSVALSLAVITPIQTARVVFAPYDNGPLRAEPERGMRDVIALLRREVPASGAIVSLKDIGYYSERRYIGLEQLMGREPGTLVAITRRDDVWGLVDSALRPLVPPEQLAALQVRRRIEIGTYRIYVLAH